jgi:8-demethyl-8-(2-methoxy-alpha-L-rhamnosyl)tetracenomycin-C 3'-O-methyltransferase
VFAGYDTDKHGYHDYGPLYESLFPGTTGAENVTAVLELGIFHGGSLRAFRDHYPNATIVGLDVDESTMIHGEPRIVTVCGDVRDAKALRQAADSVVYNYDLIVDDASHRPIDQYHALKHLWPRLRVGGFYAIEDLDLNRQMAIMPTVAELVRGQAKITLHLLTERRNGDVLVLEKTRDD